jgi:hypothetical protein
MKGQFYQKKKKLMKGTNDKNDSGTYPQSRVLKCLSGVVLKHVILLLLFVFIGK